MLHRLTAIIIMVTLMGLGLTGCFGGLWNPKWLYGEPWQPTTQLPKRPVYCPEDWHYLDKNIDHPGWTLSDEERYSCDRWIGRYKIAMINLKSEINIHNIETRGSGYGGYGYSSSGGDREVTIITGPNGHVRRTVIKNPDAGDRFRAIGSGGKWGAYAW